MTEIERIIESLRNVGGEGSVLRDIVNNPDCSLAIAKAIEQYVKDTHCKDCCCARAWNALGGQKHKGKSIDESITLLIKEHEQYVIKARIEEVGFIRHDVFDNRWRWSSDDYKRERIAELKKELGGE